MGTHREDLAQSGRRRQYQKGLGRTRVRCEPRLPQREPAGDLRKGEPGGSIGPRGRIGELGTLQCAPRQRVEHPRVLPPGPPGCFQVERGGLGRLPAACRNSSPEREESNRINHARPVPVEQPLRPRWPANGQLCGGYAQHALRVRSRRPCHDGMPWIGRWIPRSLRGVLRQQRAAACREQDPEKGSRAIDQLRLRMVFSTRWYSARAAGVRRNRPNPVSSVKSSWRRRPR
jgi:hypothetical protein